MSFKKFFIGLGVFLVGLTLYLVYIKEPFGIFTGFTSFLAFFSAVDE